MNILFVLTYYRPYWTGLTQHAARLAEGLADRGHQIEVVCCRHQRDLPQSEFINKVKVYRVPALCRLTRTIIAPTFPLEVAQRIPKAKLVVAYLPLAEVSLVALVAKALKRKLFLVHNGDLVMPKGIGNWVLEKLYYTTTSFAIGLSDGVIIHTEDYARTSKLLRKWKEKWRICLPLFRTGKASRKAVEEFKNQARFRGKKLIGFAGRFVEEKGIDVFLEALPKVAKQIPNIHAVFAGEHRIPYEKYWERISPLVERNKAKITLLGLINDQSRLSAFYTALDAFVLPSRSDCFPLAQVEAMLSGTPVVCTNIPGARQVVKQTGMGIIVEPGNPTLLAEGIIKVLNNRQQYTKPEDIITRIFNYEKTLTNYEILLRH